MFPKTQSESDEANNTRDSEPEHRITKLSIKSGFKAILRTDWPKYNEKLIESKMPNFVQEKFETYIY